MRGLLASEVDARNALLLLKGKSAELGIDEILSRWLDGGTIPASQAPELYGARSVPELADRFADKYPSIGEGTADFTSLATLTSYEALMHRDRALAELGRLRTYPLSLAVIFTFLLLGELERGDLRRIAFGKIYGLPNDRLAPLLAGPRL